MNESDSAGGGATTGTAGGVASRATTTTATRGTTAAGLPDRRIVRGEQRRREILRTAVEVFGEQGFRGSSLREIAARVGISEAGLLHHFGSKAGLLTATLEERDRRDLVRRTEDEAAGADLLTTIRDQVRRNAETPGLVSLHVVVAAEATDAAHPAHDVVRDRYRALRHQDDTRFQDAVARGELRPEVDPQAIGQLFSAVMDGLQLQWLLDPDNVDMVALFDQFLALLRPEGSAPAAPAPRTTEQETA
ncbi:TetR/AcrR family transcriptional regulator [Cellulosimicrobium cellulans]|uniref:HTH tetR-type domain-containing protein n=2 Tax=Cellulosimicrobium TaxID=157920 RepID=A0A0H2L867_9MICO|nr:MULTISPECIES: TetR/AcrR family transcriptional regulator [Cellulosimicrobium]KLN36407.1 hypothetical protein FB00_00725 [Cellulosimicrobium funkei]KON73292.1 hypothetical protein M768_10150 [Cellulosimicrobium cellulans F16]